MLSSIAANQASLYKDVTLQPARTLYMDVSYSYQAQCGGCLIDLATQT